MLETDEKNVLPEEYKSRLRKITYNHIGIFQIAFLSGLPARFTYLRIELTADSAPTECCLRNYSAEQQKFMRSATSKLMAAGTIFPNPSAKWTFAPLIVSKPGDGKFWFKVDFRAANRFTIPHHYPIPNLGNEATRLQGNGLSQVGNRSYQFNSG